MALAKLPENQKQWELIKKQFKKMKVEDSPETWTFIISQLQNTKMPELKFSYENVFAHYKRWKIAKVLQDEKAVYLNQLQDKLNALLASANDAQSGESDEGAPSLREHTEHVPNGAFHSEGELPPLPSVEEGVVSDLGDEDRL